MKRRILDSLHRSAGQLPQADFNAIRNAEVAPMEKHDYITRQEEAKPRRPVRRLALATACLVCLIAVALGGGWYWQYGMVDSIVDIDLNPSYDITVNRQGQVLAITPMNKEAERVLQGRSYNGWDIEEAIYTLFSDLPQHGFLESGEPAVLVSVSGRSADRAAELGERVSQTIGYSMMGSPVSPTVVTQAYSQSSSLQQRATEYGVSPGKMFIVDALLEQGVPYTEAQLAAMDIENLLALARKYGFEGLVDHYYPGTAAPKPQPPASSSVPPGSSSTGQSVVDSSSQPPPSVSSSQPASTPPPPAPTGDSPYDDNTPYDDDRDDDDDDADDADDDSPHDDDDDDD